MLAGARAQMIAEERAQKNRHTEVQARMNMEACVRMLGELRAWTFIMRMRLFLLRVQAYKESRASIFLLKLWACTEAGPWKFPQEMR